MVGQTSKLFLSCSSYSSDICSIKLRTTIGFPSTNIVKTTQSLLSFLTSSQIASYIIIYKMKWQSKSK